ncbi:type VII secretion-associated protein [Corynebacterium qintianiae]|uniref:type VII secretion-associated protein n=1 Tax=Corynebacterium qintianiae TaxID=2709392 RepID=UPI0013EA1696|nr:type VII secretion-associated protein [Corynebacterium qintianiae]
MTTTHPDLTISIKQSSTVFEGLANVRRYDRPSASEIANYVRSVVGPSPHGYHVHIEAEEDEFQRVAQALADYDVTLTHDQTQGEGRHALKDPEPIEVERPSADSGQHRSSWLVAACVGAVVVLCAGAIWATMSALGRNEPEVPVAPEETSTSEEPAPAAVVISREGLMVEAPAGFKVEPDGDMWRASGEDPNFRLQLAVDPLYQLPPAALIEQILTEIENDPQVELLNNEGSALTYRETGTDGSQALWKTWVEGGHHISIGCHSRSAPTQVQAATCRMAVDSATFNAERAAG